MKGALGNIMKQAQKMQENLQKAQAEIMAMEITGFLAWIALRRRLPRGVRVPGVGRLFDERHKRRVWWLHAAASLSLALACVLPGPARLAGALLLLAWLGAAWALWRCWRTASTWHP